jgi:signal transduction histidine kinase
MATTALVGAAVPDVDQAPRLRSVVMIALAGCAGAACTVVVASTGDGSRQLYVQAALADWITLSYIAAGLVAWWRRPSSGLGRLMVAAGFVNVLSSLAVGGFPVAYTIGEVLDFLPPVLFLHVFLAYPTGRLERSFERRYLAAAYATAIGPSVVRLLLGDEGQRHDVLVLRAVPAASHAVVQVQLVAMSALMLGGIGVVVARRRTAGRPLRRSVTLLVDSFALGLVMIALLYLSVALGWPGVEVIRRATFFVIGLAPLAFLLGLLQARLARSSVGDLVVALRTQPTPADLRDALARALRDPSLTLAYWLEGFEVWVDIDGRPVQVPSGNSERSVTAIDRDGTPVAALLHDIALKDEPDLLAGVVAAAGIALENARLQAELRARLEELQGSRVRIIEAGQKERQRLERDLHDGAQQRLIALSLELGLLEQRTGGDTEVKTRLDRARGEIASSLAELRSVARGLHPAVVTGHGLGVALEQLVARASVPVRLDLGVASRLPERLANIAKHAEASAATVEVAICDSQLVVEVTDDGIGGADAETGSGLRGLADRVEALGGRLRVWSPPGGGTRLRAEIPCAL